MNVLLLSASEETQAWVSEGVTSMDATPEINRCVTLDFARRVLLVHDDVNLIVVDTGLAGINAPDAIKLLWRACRSALVVAASPAPSTEEMLSCVNAGAVGYVPRGLQLEELHRVLSHVSAGGYWIPDLQRGRDI